MIGVPRPDRGRDGRGHECGIHYSGRAVGNDAFAIDTSGAQPISTADFLSRRALEKPPLADLWSGYELGRFLETTGKQPNRYAPSMLADQPAKILDLFPEG